MKKMIARSKGAAREEKKDARYQDVFGRGKVSMTQKQSYREKLHERERDERKKLLQRKRIGLRQNHRKAAQKEEPVEEMSRSQMIDTIVRLQNEKARRSAGARGNGSRDPRERRKWKPPQEMEMKLKRLDSREMDLLEAIVGGEIDMT